MSDDVSQALSLNPFVWLCRKPGNVRDKELSFFREAFKKKTVKRVTSSLKVGR